MILSYKKPRIRKRIFQLSGRLVALCLLDTGSKGMKGIDASPHFTKSQPCVTVIDLIGIALFLAVVIVHFLLCRKGPYRRLSG